ncbi:MAG: AraC family transcriptional regulator [Bacteroidota bacterium]
MEELDLKSTDERHILDMGILGFQCIKVLGQYNYREMRNGLAMHRHEGMLEICYLDKGEQHYNIEGEDYLMKGGDFLLTFPGEEHGTMGYPEEKGRLYWLVIILPEYHGKKRLLNLTEDETYVITQRLFGLKTNRIFKGSPQTKNHLQKIFNIFNEKQDTYRKIRIACLLLSFLLHVVELGEKSIVKNISETIGKIKNYIQENVHEDLKMEVLASLGHLSVSHFKYRFKNETGITPGDYILRQKIEAAKNLLKDNQPVKDVAYELAFSSPSYFSTVFKRYTGLAPSDFKEKDLGTRPIQ